MYKQRKTQVPPKLRKCLTETEHLSSQEMGETKPLQWFAIEKGENYKFYSYKTIKRLILSDQRKQGSFLYSS